MAGRVQNIFACLSFIPWFCDSPDFTGSQVPSSLTIPGDNWSSWESSSHLLKTLGCLTKCGTGQNLEILQKTKRKSMIIPQLPASSPSQHNHGDWRILRILVQRFICSYNVKANANFCKAQWLMAVYIFLGSHCLFRSIYIPLPYLHILCLLYKKYYHWFPFQFCLLELSMAGSVYMK